MKKIILVIISIVIILMAFIIGIQLSNVVKKSKKSDIEDVRENTVGENGQESNIKNKGNQDDNAGINKIYYLHKSDIEIPDKNRCSIAKTFFFKGVSESDKKEIQTEIRIYT